VRLSIAEICPVVFCATCGVAFAERNCLTKSSVPWACRRPKDRRHVGQRGRRPDVDCRPRL
jgi:hypothetical protein